MPFAAILAAMQAVPALFSLGRKAYETVAGTPSTASSPDDLLVEVEALPAPGQDDWQGRMDLAIEQYRAETDRLRVEIGEVTPAILEAIGPKAAAKVALKRMTTRPDIARDLRHVIMTPVYVMAYDGVMTFAMNVAAIFGHPIQLDRLGALYFADGSLYMTLYTWAAGFAASVIGTYMTLRQIGKAKGQPDALGLGAAFEAAIGAVGGAAKAFRAR